MIAAAGPAPPQRGQLGERLREARVGPRRLGQQVDRPSPRRGVADLPLEQQQDRLADLVVADAYQVVEDVVQDPTRVLADLLHRDPVRDRGPLEPRLDADDAEIPLDPAQRERDPGRKAASADGNDDGLGLRARARGIASSPSTLPTIP